MKKLSLFILIFTNIFFAQTISEKEDTILAEVPLNIWDVDNSEKSFKIDTLTYDEIPKYLDFRGTLVTALTWTDAKGENLLVLSKSGEFGWKEYVENNKTKYYLNDKSEIFAYLFLKSNDSNSFIKQWRIYDFIECSGVDMYGGFINQATTVTDIDKDGIAEVAIPYSLFCRGGLDPGIMKIIMYEGNNKYAMRGETAICRDGKVLYGGEYKTVEATQKNEKFQLFLKERWAAHKCE